VVKSTRTAAAGLHTTDDPTSVHKNTRSYLRSKQLEMAAVNLIFISAVFGLFKLDFDGNHIRNKIILSGNPSAFRIILN
jgi:hypothetical protein